MIEKIRISLWDIVSLFLTGSLAAFLLSIFMVAAGKTTFSALMLIINSFTAPLAFIFAPLALALVGLLIEPFANRFDKKIISPIMKQCIPRYNKDEKEEALLKEEIKTKYLGSLNGKVDSPYGLCKEYVETKNLSTTFMVFLSRYGFYRGCVFLAFLSAVASLFIVRPLWCALISTIFCLFSLVLFKLRQDDFYSYTAPAVYRAFLIDKLDWKPKG